MTICCERRGIAGVLVAGLLAAGASSQQPPPYAPPIQPASKEAEAQLAKFQPAPGLAVSLVAAEPLLANPVAFSIDAQGRFLVAETWRIKSAVLDARDYMKWLDDDLACRTVADRIALLRRQFKDDFARFSQHHELLRLVVDENGDGVADRGTIWADGFNDPAQGVGAGVLPFDGQVYYTCIPEIWRLRDQDGDGKADAREALHTGFGVHVSLMGHDMHGLCVGPDRRIWFSIGDRGFCVRTPGGELRYPDTGAVLRMEPDGKDLEVFAWGLRNPQELAFDRFGNLFTGDNNSDGGDRARLVYVVEGGDSGWRTGFQWLRTRGPWNEEKLWHAPFAEQAPSIVPPICNLGSGPSGFAYYPGTGLPARYDDTFFLCDFRGSAAISGIHAVRLQPHGAGFEVESLGRLVWRVLATDCEFGPDAGLYLTDWVHGWRGEGKGRIYRVHDPRLQDDPRVQEVKRLLREGLRGKQLAELLALLDHQDMRVRLQAQFALADLGESAAQRLWELALQPERRLARVHAIWALLLLARRGAAELAPLVKLLDDPDAEIRAQACKALGEAKVAAAGKRLRSLLVDLNARVRYHAALALGRLPDAANTPSLLALLRDNADRDVYLRHAAALSLARLADHDALRAAAADPSPAVRTGALLALRRLRSKDVALWLADRESRLVREAARAIHDEPVDDALPQLAAVVLREGITDVPTLRRALNACFVLGGPQSLRMLLGFAARPSAPDDMRVEALKAALDWNGSSRRDRVLGDFRPLQEPRADVAPALRSHLAELLERAPDAVREAAAQVCGKHGVKEAVPLLRALVADGRGSRARRAALRALDALGDEKLPESQGIAARDPDPVLRKVAIEMLVPRDPAAAVKALDALLLGAPPREQQGAFEVLGRIETPAADALLVRELDRLQAGGVAPEVQLDLLEVARQRKSPVVTERLQRYLKSLPSDDPLAEYRAALHGGDKEKGDELFWNSPVAICTKCHAIDGSGGEAGPDLGKLSERMTREQMLEAIVLPNQTITPGFATLTVTLQDGAEQSGLLLAEDATSVTLQTAAGEKLVFDKRTIKSRGEAVSAMPPMGLVLGKRELRDLIEYLADLKDRERK
jgi:quinoprotein glucose dehydrogenase